MEAAGSIDSVKYLYKYVYKGQDRTTVETTVHRTHAAATEPPTTATIPSEPAAIRIDEIKDYVEGRYVTGHEAAWHLLGLPMHYCTHTVIRLPVHLDQEERVTFDPTVSADELRSAFAAEANPPCSPIF